MMHWIVLHWPWIVLALYLASVLVFASLAGLFERECLEQMMWLLIAAAVIVFYPVTMIFCGIVSSRDRRRDAGSEPL